MINDIVSLQSIRQAINCQCKAVIRRWIIISFQKVKVLFKHTLVTPSYGIDCVTNITHTPSVKYRAIKLNLSRDKIEFIA